MFPHPTIKDVAKAAGVHFTTVSLALRGKKGLPPATRERILAIANRLGYRRNPVYAALSQTRHSLPEAPARPRLAYVLNRAPDQGLDQHRHHLALIEGARQEAENLGYLLEVFYLDRGHHDSASLDAELQREGISGLIVGAFEAERGDLLLPWERYSVVKIDTRHLAPTFSLVASDQLYGVRDALLRMRALGYQRVGLAVGRVDEEGTDAQHEAGWLLAQASLPAEEVPAPAFFPGNGQIEEAVAVLRAYIAQERLDAVVCNWVNIREMIRKAGYRCPSEVACACLCLPGKVRGLAGIVSNLSLVGARAAALLDAQLRVEQRGVPVVASRTSVRGLWSEGASAPPRAKGRL